MTETTTVKVRKTTRDLLLELGSARKQTADQVIQDALTALLRDKRRRVAAEEAQSLQSDPVDLAEIREIQQEMAVLREG